MNSEVIYTFIFLIASPVFLILSLETQKRVYFYISISIVGLYLVYMIYLINKHDITALFIIHHLFVLIALGISYLYVDEENEKRNRNKILNKVVVGLALLIIFTIPS